MRDAPRILHSHTQSMRLACGAEALVVRIHVEGGASGYGFTFSEDVAAARAMALADAAAKASGQAFADWHDDDTRRALARVAPDDMHPWSQGWRAMLAGTQAAIDWQAEAGFATLTWAEPALKPA